MGSCVAVAVIIVGQQVGQVDGVGRGSHFARVAADGGYGEGNRIALGVNGKSALNGQILPHCNNALIVIWENTLPLTVDGHSTIHHRTAADVDQMGIGGQRP